MTAKDLHKKKLTKKNNTKNNFEKSTEIITLTMIRPLGLKQM